MLNSTTATNSTITTPATDDWLTPDEAAPLARVSAATLRRECQHKRLRHARLGGGRKLIRIRRSWLHEWMERSAVEVSR